MEQITKIQYKKMLSYYKTRNELPPTQMVKSGAKYGSMKWRKYEDLTTPLKEILVRKYRKIEAVI